MKPRGSICACAFREKSLFYNMLILERIHVDEFSINFQMCFFIILDLSPSKAFICLYYLIFLKDECFMTRLQDVACTAWKCMEHTPTPLSRIKSIP